jgi:hypothetical protein
VYVVRLIDLPPAVRGCTRPNNDGTYTIYINAVLSVETRRKVLRHELAHIKKDHLYSDDPIGKIEAEAV